MRMLTSGTTGPPKRIDLSYDTLERVLVGAKHYEANRDTALRLRADRRRRELAARPSRGSVPRAAVHQRRPPVRAARAIHGRRVGRRRPSPPPGHGQPRARRAAHGARGRRRSRRPRQPPVGRFGHRAALTRRRRRVRREVRRPGADLVRRDRVRRRGRGVEHRRPP